MKQEQLSKLNRAKQAMKREDNHIAEVNQRMEEQLKADKLQFIDADEQLAKSNTIGKVIADKVAKIGGSWGFVISFMVFLVVWMVINVMQLFGWHFDPYPFILLNLALSCISAIQAPIIMMSQNRAGEKDNITRDNDFKTNQRTNIQTKLLSSKLDHLMRYQRNQTEMLEVIVEMADEGNSIDTNKLSEKLGEAIERKNGKTTLL